MLTTLPLSLLALAFASCVAAQRSLVPPPVSAPDAGSSSSSSGSATSSASASSNGSTSVSATPTSSAAFPSLSGLSDCATNCLELAIASDNCSSVVDVNCYCAPKANSTRFASTLVGCITNTCSSDLSSAESIAEQFCALASTSISVSFPTSASFSSFSNPFTSTLSPTSSSSSSNSSATASSNATTSSSASASATSSTQANGAGVLQVSVHSAVIPAFVGLIGAVFAF